MYGRKLENYKRSQFRCRLSYSKHGARFLLPKHVNKIGQHPRAALETPEDPPVDNLALPATKSSHFWVVSQKLRNLSLNPGTPLTFHFVSSQTTFIENGNPPPPRKNGVLTTLDPVTPNMVTPNVVTLELSSLGDCPGHTQRTSQPYRYEKSLYLCTQLSTVFS